MARPIEPTPILTGKDAEQFLKKMASPQKIEKKQLNIKEIAQNVHKVFSQYAK